MLRKRNFDAIFVFFVVKMKNVVRWARPSRRHSSSRRRRRSRTRRQVRILQEPLVQILSKNMKFYSKMMNFESFLLFLFWQKILLRTSSRSRPWAAGGRSSTAWCGPVFLDEKSQNLMKKREKTFVKAVFGSIWTFETKFSVRFAGVRKIKIWKRTPHPSAMIKLGVISQKVKNEVVGCEWARSTAK